MLSFCTYKNEHGLSQVTSKNSEHISLNILVQIIKWRNMYQKFKNKEIIKKRIIKLKK